MHSAQNHKTQEPKTSTGQSPVPAPRLLVTMTEADLDARDQRLLDTMIEIFDARPRKKLLDPAGVEQLLGVTAPTIRRLRSEGMPYVRVGESYRYDGDAVLEWLRQREEGTPR
jgi:excisionase family DNA binding protein